MEQGHLVHWHTFVHLSIDGLILDPPAKPEPCHPLVLPAVQQLLAGCFGPVPHVEAVKVQLVLLVC